MSTETDSLRHLIREELSRVKARPAIIPLRADQDERLRDVLGFGYHFFREHQHSLRSVKQLRPFSRTKYVDVAEAIEELRDPTRIEWTKRKAGA